MNLDIKGMTCVSCETHISKAVLAIVGVNDVSVSYKNTNAIYLKTSIATIVERLTNEKNQRPLVARLKEDELAEFVAKHLFERSYFYNKSKYKLAVDTKNTAEIVDEVYKLLS